MDEPPRQIEVPVAPPPVPTTPAVGMLSRLIPVATLVVTAAMVAVAFVVGSPLLSNPMFMAFPVMMALSALAGLAHGAGRQGLAELNAARRRYLEYLGEVGTQLADDAAVQRQWLQHTHPEPDTLWALADTARRWERDDGHPAFCRVRVGVGQAAALSAPVAPTQTDGADVDPVTQTALQRLVAAYSVLRDVPVTVDLRTGALVRLPDDEAGRGLARALLCQLVTFHRPGQVRVVAVVAETQRAQWEWLKWLPHHGHPVLTDDIGPVRLCYPDLPSALAETSSLDSHVVILIDGIDVAADRFAGHPGLSGISIGARTVTDDPVSPTQADTMSVVAAATCARRLSAHQEMGEGSSRRGWLELAGVSDPEALTRRWGGRALRVPLGVGDGGVPLHLDINEAAYGGVGPHGLCLGATGSGKSELLRTIALGMIALHSPEDLNLILVDFKGGATFLGLDRANHVTAVITNLAEEAYLVDRMQDALAGEIQRRQQLLRDAGNLPGVAAYSQARRAQPDLPPLPALFVIVDEFSELLSRNPDFIDVFVAIGRLGRSLGIHLLLASQRLDDGRLRGLDSHLSYRICLKTLSPNESRLVIDTPDAYHLPPTPGAGYLKAGSDAPIRFQAAHVSAPVPRRPERSLQTLHRPVLFTAEPCGPVRAAADTAPSGCGDGLLLDAVLDALAGHGPRAHQVWLPPLVDSPALAQLLPAFAGDGTLTVPIGLSDRAFDQRLAPVIVELSGAAGNMAVVGAPQSGKSTVVRTLAMALSATHRPERVQLYCLDFGGGALASLADLPHVGVVAGRAHPDLVRRTVAQVAAVVRNREIRFGQIGISSMAEYRARPDSSDAYGDVFLVVDGWASVRQDFDTLEATITALATDGLSFGVHVVLTASRWADLRPALKDQIGTRIELRLGDPVDSEIDRKRARLVPPNRPGHGLAADGFPMVVALPDGDGDASPRTGRPAPEVRVLPAHLDYQEMLSTEQTTLSRLVLGAGDEAPLVMVDLAAQPFLVISGDSGCGRTSALRLVSLEILRTTAAELYVVDPRRMLRAAVDPGRLAGYAPTAELCGAQVGELATTLRQRLSGERWTGPEVCLLVDDYDLISGAAQGNPLGPIVDLLPHARDIGLRLVLARRSAGAARALYDPVLSVLRDLDAAGLQMSHTGDDGPLLGRSRPRQLPPGRGTLITRGAEWSVQVAWVPPQ